MGKREQGKSQSYPSHCIPCLTCRKGEGGRKKLKHISIEEKTTQIQVSKFFIDHNLPNFALN